MLKSLFFLGAPHMFARKNKSQARNPQCKSPAWHPVTVGLARPCWSVWYPGLSKLRYHIPQIFFGKMRQNVGKTRTSSFLDFLQHLRGWCQHIPNHRASRIPSDIWDILPYIDSLKMGQHPPRVLHFRVFNNNKSPCGRTKAAGVPGSLLTARIRADSDGIWAVITW